MSIFSFLRRSVARGETNGTAPVTQMSPSAERRRLNRLRVRRGTRVLVIDDSKTVTVALGRMLRQNHYETMEAHDAETGLPMARNHRPDLIFLDIVLPGMNGFNALRALRRDAITQNIPVIMISGNDQAVERFYVERIGADAFLRKPFSRGDVFETIERLLTPEMVPRRRTD